MEVAERGIGPETGFYGEPLNVCTKSLRNKLRSQELSGGPGPNHVSEGFEG